VQGGSGEKILRKAQQEEKDFEGQITEQQSTKSEMEREIGSGPDCIG